VHTSVSQNYSGQAGADMIHSQGSSIEQQGRNVESHKGPNLSDDVFMIKNSNLMLFSAMRFCTSE